jgi:hypothetical protein
VKQALQNAINLYADVSYTLEIERLQEYFINDERFPLEDSTIQFFREMTGDPSITPTGYHDYLYYLRKCIRDYMIRETAESEPSSSRNTQVGPSGCFAGRTLKRDHNIPITFISVEIDGNIATVKVYIPPSDGIYTLVKIDGKWFVADYIQLSVNP